MQLEPLLVSLGLSAYIPQLSEYRDALIRENAEALQNLTIAKDAERTDALTALSIQHAAEIADLRSAAVAAGAGVISVTPLQMRRALNASNLRDAVEAAVAAAPQDVRDAWEFATEIRRNDALLISLATALGKSDADLDILFQLAASFV
jgi:hypothetical protein